MVTVSEGDKILGYGYFCKEKQQIEFLGTSEVSGGELVSDYGDIVCFPGKEEIVWKEIIKYLRKEYKGWLLKLDFMRENPPSFKVLTNLGLEKEKTDIAVTLTLPASWDDYLLALKRKDRQELRRKIRRLEAHNIEYLYKTTVNSSQVESLLRLMSQSDPAKKKFLSEKMKSFFRELAVHLDRSNVSLSFLVKGDHYIAATISFEYRARVYLYNSGYDLNYSQIAPGLILKAYLIRTAIEKGYRVFDFLRGNEPYKYDLGGIDNQLYIFKLSL